jgi:hypothetical protein
MMTCSITGTVSQASTCDIWQRGQPFTVGNALHDVAHVSGIWIAVGKGGTILTSPDGFSWTRQDSGTDMTLFKVGGSSGRYVVTGERGALLVSEDTVTWSSAGHLPFWWVEEIIWTGSRFVAVGIPHNRSSSNSIMTSPNGVSWTLVYQAPYQSIEDVVQTSDGLVAAGEGLVLLSSDGLTWQEATTRSLYHLASNSQIIVGAYWQDSLWWSEDGGSSWQITAYPSDSIYYHDLVWTGAEFLAVGRHCHSCWGDLRVYRSTDGKQWSELEAPNDRLVYSAAGAGGTAVMVGDWGAIKTWSAAAGWQVADPGKELGLLAAASSGTRHAAVGRDGFGATSTDDGRTWQPHELPDGESLEDVIWIDASDNQPTGQFLAVGWHANPDTAVVATSSDGISWQVRDLFPGQRFHLSGLTSTPFGIVAVGAHQETYTLVALRSSDGGVTWSYHGTPHYGWWQKVAWDGTRLVATSDSSLLSSNDGVTWTDVTPDFADDFYMTFYDIASDGNGFVMVGQHSRYNGFIWWSPDGQTWSVLAERLQLRPYAVEPIGDRFLVAGPVTSTYLWSSGLQSPFVWCKPDGSLYWPDISALYGGVFTGVSSSDTGIAAVGFDGTTTFTTSSVAASDETPVITGPSLVCAGDTVTLETTGSYQSYLWESSSSDIGSTRSVTIYPQETDGYRVTVGDGSGCHISSPVHTINVLPLPEVRISGPYGICPGGRATLDAGGGFTEYLWSTGATSRLLTVAPPETTEYTVTVTNSDGCSATAAYTVNALRPEPEIEGPTRIVKGESAELGVAGSWYGYLWSNGSRSSYITVSPSATTGYSVRVTDSYGCQGESAVHTIEVIPTTVFSDGFESGDISRWSDAVP